MNTFYLVCQECGRVLATDNETMTGLCTRCRNRMLRRLRARSNEEDRSSLMDDSALGMGLENLGE